MAFITEFELLSWYAETIGLDISNYDPVELVTGYRIEQEHDTDDTKPEIDVVKDKVDPLKIAVAHLDEDPQYYTKLKRMENEGRYRLGDL